MKTAPLVFSLFLLTSGRGESRGVQVLCYHGFQTNKNRFSFLLNEVKSQLEFLQRRGFRFVTFSEIRSGNISGKMNLLVTVDDGNRSVYDAYFRLFKPMKIKPLLAIYPAITGREKYALTWEQLKRLSREGCEIAAHGYSHRYLNSRLYHRERDIFKREIFYSKELLERKLGKSVEIFVYPYGVKSPEAVKALKSAGYRYAFTVENGTMSLSSAGGDSLYMLPRYMITRGTGRLYLEKIAMKAERENPVSTVVEIEKEPAEKPKIKSLSLKPVKEPQPFFGKDRADIVYRDNYRDVEREKKSYLVNLDFKDSPGDLDLRSGIAPVYDHDTRENREKSGGSMVFSGFGIAEIPGYDGMYASRSGGLKDHRGSGEFRGGVCRSFYRGLKSRYRRSAVSSYRYYSLWIERIRLKMDSLRKKAGELIDRIFT